ncbi:hypothetical protein GIB67_014247 [Kingdonia uniflora]|uniref:Secreted protein n=1 Tax=Kingdonia uniflora TaxID=39325 RepID=A0A7J7M1X5_9MAGN|nr:hypothetical protein GIB67_014247 [Kingdonia uniflora]
MLLVLSPPILVVFWSCASLWKTLSSFDIFHRRNLPHPLYQKISLRIAFPQITTQRCNQVFQNLHPLYVHWQSLVVIHHQLPLTDLVHMNLPSYYPVI